MRMIAVVNSLSMFSTHKDSDIDLFIICAPKTLWFVRICTTFLFHILGVRRHHAHIQGQLCLSFFCTTDDIDMSTIALDQDIYLYYWVYFLKPLINIQSTYEDFIHANDWVQIPDAQIQKNTKWCQHARSFGAWFAQILNPIVKFIFLPITRRHYARLGHPPGIRITDTMLKFHNHDVRAKIRDAILQKSSTPK